MFDVPKNTINLFRGSFEFLSNFYITPVNFEGLVYNSAECAFQAAKTLNQKEREQFVNMDPRTAKRMGRMIPLRKDWEQIKDTVMLEIVRNKFKTGVMKEKLLATGDAKLIEGNWWGDEYWGICRNKGLNKLGNILMKVRDELNEQKDFQV